MRVGVLRQYHDKWITAREASIPIALIIMELKAFFEA
jgi:hypothetical protein